MASEPKPFASLSSGLLARKGAARPAMKPQGFGQMGGGNLEDLGWNDMGFEPPKPAEAPRDATHDAFGDDVVDHPRAHPSGLTPVGSPVHSQVGVGGVVDADADVEVADPAAAAEADLVEHAAAVRSVRNRQLGRLEEELPPARARPDEEETAAATVLPAPEPILTPAPEPIIASAPVVVARRAPTPRAAPGSKAKAAFTLRLDPPRHLKLRLACAVNGRSAQQIVTDALDRLLNDMPELDAMAEKAKRKG